MAEDADGDAKRPPHAPVIDLEAEAIDGAPQASEPPPPPPSRKSRARWWGAGALGLALMLAGAWVYRDVGSAFWPTSAMTDLGARVTTVEAAAKTIGDQLKGLGGALDAVKTETAGLASELKVASGESDAARADAAAAGAAVAAINVKIDDAAKRIAALESALAGVQSALSSGAPVTVSPADTARLDGLAARIDELEKTVAALQSAGPSGPDEGTARLLSQTLAGLKAKLAAGAPYTDELARLQSLVPAASGLDTLAATAADGLPTARQLLDQLAKLAPTLPGPPEPAAADDSSWGWFTSLFDGVVTVRDLGETDWRALAATASGAPLDQAVAALAAAEGGMPPALAAWLQLAKARLAGDAALEAVSAAVLRQIAALGGTP